MGIDGRVDIPYEGPEIIFFFLMTATSFLHTSHRGTCQQNHGFPWNQLSINPSTWIWVFTGLSPWKNFCCCLLKKKICQGGTSWFCLPNWREHSRKNVLKKKKDRKKHNPCSILYIFCFFFSNTASKHYNESLWTSKSFKCLYNEKTLLYEFVKFTVKSDQ